MVYYLAKLHFGAVAKPIFAQITERDPKLAEQSADMSRKAWEAQYYELIPMGDEWNGDKPACAPGEEDPETPSVGRCAELAVKALRGGEYLTHEDFGVDEEYVISDLIVDLLHLAESKGIGTEELIERAMREFEEESI